MSVYSKAARILFRRGWYQGTYVDPCRREDGPVCVIGAVGIAKCGDPFEHPYPESKTLAALVPDWMSAVEFNDDPNTTREDVLRLLHKAHWQHVRRTVRRHLAIVGDVLIHRHRP